MPSQHQQQAHHHRVAQRHRHRQPRDSRRARVVPGAHVEADADAGRGAERHGDHERRPVDVASDAVRRDGHHAQAADQKAHHREQHHAHERRKPDGNADLQDVPDLQPIRAFEALPQASGAEVAEAGQHQHGAELEPHHDGGGPAAALAAKLRSAELAVDEGVVEHRVQRQRGAGDHHRPHGVANALGGAAQQDVGEARRQAEGGRGEVAHGDVRGGGIDAEQGEGRFGIDHQTYRRRTGRQRQQQPLAHHGAHFRQAPAADQLRRYRRDGHGEAAQQQKHRPHHVAAQGNASQMHGVVVAGHGGIHEPHAHDEELRRRDGRAEAHEGPRLAPAPAALARRQ